MDSPCRWFVGKSTPTYVERQFRANPHRDTPTLTKPMDARVNCASLSLLRRWLQRRTSVEAALQSESSGLMGFKSTPT
jgi:hypothetical protein